VCAVQFHPESILTPFGKQLLRNWINSWLIVASASKI
jgi:anthranilate/para-aminobenzoate synthase component II